MNLTLCIDMYGCPNQCKHCWIGHLPNRVMKDDEAVAILNQFKQFFPEITFYSWFREPDYGRNYQKRWEMDNELSTGRKPERFELASFFKLHHDPKYVKFLKEVGTQKVQLSVFGLDKTTDKYVGRKGAFREIYNATSTLISKGIVPRWQIFINEENKKEIPELIELMKIMRFPQRCPEFSFFLNEGSCDGENMKLYDIRIRKESITPKLRQYYPDFDKKLTEAELCEQLKTEVSAHFIPSNNKGDTVVYVDSNYNVYFNFTHATPEWAIGNLKTDSMKEIARRITREDIPALNCAKKITIAKLVEKYGDPTSTRLFEEGDFKMYLLNRYLADNL